MIAVLRAGVQRSSAMPGAREVHDRVESAGPTKVAVVDELARRVPTDDLARPGESVGSNEAHHVVAALDQCTRPVHRR